MSREVFFGGGEGGQLETLEWSTCANNRLFIIIIFRFYRRGFLRILKIILRVPLGKEFEKHWSITWRQVVRLKAEMAIGKCFTCTSPLVELFVAPIRRSRTSKSIQKQVLCCGHNYELRQVAHWHIMAQDDVICTLCHSWSTGEVEVFLKELPCL
jgi:hypothetical protein